MQKLLWPACLFDGWGMDRLDAMQVLLAVVDEGSLSAGGRRLNMSLPSVSRKMSELEDRLGARLLIRTTRNIQLTDAGRDYVNAIRPIVSQLEDAERRASGEYDEPRGELCITIPGDSSRFFVVPLLLEFLDLHPEISLNIVAAEQNLDLVDQRVDVGVRLGELADSSLYAVSVGEAVISTVASPGYLERNGYPLHPRDLPDHDGIWFDSIKLSGWTYSVDGEIRQYLPRFRVRANRITNCIEAAARGFGITRTAVSAIENELRSGALVRILSEFECMSFPVHLVYVKQGLMPRKVRAFLDWMTPRLRNKLKEHNAICSKHSAQAK